MLASKKKVSSFYATFRREGHYPNTIYNCGGVTFEMGPGRLLKRRPP